MQFIALTELVFGHLGEGLPFWQFRLDFMHRAQVSTKRYECLKPLKRKISDHMRDNVYYTTSGMAWEPAIMFTRSVIGADRVLYANGLSLSVCARGSGGHGAHAAHRRG